MAFGWEPLQRLLDEGLDELAFEHWQEVGVDKDRIPYAPDYPAFIDMENRGAFKIMAARRAGRLVGYNGFIIARHLHYASCQAVNDVLYVAPDERWVGVSLIRQAEKLLFQMQVDRIFYHAKLHVKIGSREGTVGDLLTILGYKHIENTYSKLREAA